MRQYRFEATDETVEALRLLRGAWSGVRVEQGSFTVRLADAREVRLEVDGADVEPTFEAFRMRAVVATPVPSLQLPRGEPFDEAPDFAVGRNDVVLFTGATWIERGTADAADGADGHAAEGAGAFGPAASGDPAPRPRGLLQFSGHPGQISDTAAAVCLTTDAVVVASPVGTGFLVRVGLKPFAVEVTDDPVELDRFLRERGYDAGG